MSALHGTDSFGCYGELGGWRCNSATHKNLRRRSTTVAERLVTLGIASGVRLDPFRRLLMSNQTTLRHTPNCRYPYRMLRARFCCEWIPIKGASHGRRLGEPIAVVLEDGNGILLEHHSGGIRETI